MGNTCSGEGNVLPEPVNKLHAAAAKIETQLQDLDRKIARAEQDIKKNVALGPENKAAKQRALRTLQLKKMYEEQRANLIGTQFNVEELRAHHEQADVAFTAIQAMKAGEEEMRAQQAKMPVDMIDDLRMEMDETAEDIKMISASLAESAGALDGSDEAAMEELKKLEADLEMEMKGQLADPAFSDARPAAASAQVAARQRPARRPIGVS
eukprot:CAMPEP_0172694720 /NCGR_PEP_ID=MMETSP1074-20121228/26859_1 /TAXON_ID=2916 /ORGANISM="Ceratium fusus, Strain PA161109" /LENGTH=209 /DNA_ID=CAMNT_0013515239 /DNA_START=14 /DNA_END=643 /DNA_ORIENTATION=-